MKIYEIDKDDFTIELEPQTRRKACGKRSSLTREYVFRRDGKRCVYCGARAKTVDHVIPKSKGGRFHEYNLVAACHACNNGKAARLPWELPVHWGRLPSDVREYAQRFCMSNVAAEDRPDWAFLAVWVECEMRRAKKE
jgi:hypothetical protein